MHPAASVIFFTVASGAGYGLLAVLGLLAAFGVLQPGLVPGIAGFGLSLGLITAGLLSSTVHLGHPERAWRAISQWRSSWLSREGVMALLAYVPAGMLALLFSFADPGGTMLAVLGLLTALCATLTVYATGMIYRSLRPIHAWCNRWVVPSYLTLGAATGLLLAHAVLLAAAMTQSLAAQVAGVVALPALLLAALIKRRYWAFIDAQAAVSTPETATGLGALGPVRMLEPPHLEANFLMKEMGYRIARKHAARLRSIAMINAFLAPFVLTVLALLVPWPVSMAFAVVAAVLGLFGVAIERWLFFAQARHTVMLYYGARTA